MGQGCLLNTHNPSPKRRSTCPQKTAPTPQEKRWACVCDPHVGGSWKTLTDKTPQRRYTKVLNAKEVQRQEGAFHTHCRFKQVSAHQSTTPRYSYVTPQKVLSNQRRGGSRNNCCAPEPGGVGKIPTRGGGLKFQQNPDTWALLTSVIRKPKRVIHSCFARYFPKRVLDRPQLVINMKDSGVARRTSSSKVYNLQTTYAAKFKYSKPCTL